MVVVSTTGSLAARPGTASAVRRRRLTPDLGARRLLPLAAPVLAASRVLWWIRHDRVSAFGVFPIRSVSGSRRRDL